MRFRVPGSTSNLGHGFDCLGMAVGLGNNLTLSPVDDEAAARSGNAGLDRLCGAVREQCQLLFGQPLPPLAVRISGEVPIARGLGSSATIILAVGAAYMRLAGMTLDQQHRRELVAIGYGIEGHPDNVAAAALGGFTVAAPVEDELRCLRFPVPEALRAVLVIPPYQVATAQARQALPDLMPRETAVRGWQRSALITGAMASGDIAALRRCFSDAWHEEHRLGLNPHLSGVRSAATAAGAIGTFLSGSGSTILSLCSADDSTAVGKALSEHNQQHGLAAHIVVTSGDNHGLQELADENETPPPATKDLS